MNIRPSQAQLALQISPLFEDMHAFVQSALPLLPPGVSSASLTRVLDVGCGWHLDAGLDAVLDELNAQRIRSSWPWTLIAGSKP